MPLVDSLLSTLFPPRCLGCRRRGHILCPECAPAVPYLPDTVCPRCASPRALNARCRPCSRLSPALTQVRAICSYEGLARTAIHTLKFRSGLYLVPLLGDMLRKGISRRPLRADLVVPAPLAPERMRTRGYNQAALLAEWVVEPVHAQFAPDLLVRADRTPQQKLTASDRRLNMKGAVACAHPHLAEGKRVLLVDDVLTTGATLGACADSLIEAGASRVAALVFARDL